MQGSRPSTKRLTIVVASAWLLAFAGVAGANETPSNAELYRMILDLQAEQRRLVSEAAEARAEAARAGEQLEATRQELEAAQQELDARGPAPVSSGPSAAAPAAGAEGGLVRAAELERGFTAFAEWNFLRPSSSHLSYGTLTTEEASLFGSGSIKPVQTDYSSGYTIGFEYDFGGPADFTFRYQSLDSDYDGKLVPPIQSVDNNYVGLIATLAPFGLGQEALAATANAEFDYLSVDAEIGGNLVFGENLDVRIFGGVRYSQAFQHFKAYYFGGDFPEDMGAPLRCDANDCAEGGTDFGFWGVGPRVGTSGRYHLPWGFSIFGQVAGALLLGEKESEITFRETIDDEFAAFAHEDYALTVHPLVEMRAGIGWRRELREWGLFSVDVGYDFKSYFNVFERLAWNDADAPSSVADSTSNFGLDGVYLRGSLTFHGP